MLLTLLWCLPFNIIPSSSGLNPHRKLLKSMIYHHSREQYKNNTHTPTEQMHLISLNIVSQKLHLLFKFKKRKRWKTVERSGNRKNKIKKTHNFTIQSLSDPFKSNTQSKKNLQLSALISLCWKVLDPWHNCHPLVTRVWFQQTL